MDSKHLKKVLLQVQNGGLSLDAALYQLKKLPYENLGYARIDSHRSIRNGVAEVVFCQGKTTSQICNILKIMSETHHNILATRANSEIYAAIQKDIPDSQYYEMAKIVVVNPRRVKTVGNIAIVSAGTADMPVAEEAAITSKILGNHITRIYDVGVAGIHRLLDVCDELFQANVVVVTAGMEGALASVVGGLVSCPVIGVPTSIGYGASFGGLAALLAMINSCAAGVSVVNIDNGFGAGYQASLINKLACRNKKDLQGARELSKKIHEKAGTF